MSMSSFKVIIAETRYIVFVNDRQDESVKHVINLLKTDKSSMIQNHEDVESVLFDIDDDKTYTTVWTEMLEVGSTLTFLDGSQVLDHGTCTMIERCIRDHESVCVCESNGVVSETKIVPGNSSVIINHGNGKDDGECEICVICQEEIETGDDCCTLDDCGHVFHEECIEKWLLENNVCPTCRKTLLSSAYMI